MESSFSGFFPLPHESQTLKRDRRGQPCWILILQPEYQGSHDIPSLQTAQNRLDAPDCSSASFVDITQLFKKLICKLTFYSCHLLLYSHILRLTSLQGLWFRYF